MACPRRPTKFSSADGRYEVVDRGAQIPALAHAPLRLRMRFPRSSRARFARSFTGRSWTAATTPKANSGARASFACDLAENAGATLIGSTEEWNIIEVLDPEARRKRPSATGANGCSIRRTRRAQRRVAAELVLAADQFIITPAGRAEEAARAHASGDEVRTVIAGYHWFTDWGRDTMISLEGLTITTGRTLEAGYILRTFAHYVRRRAHPEHVSRWAKRRALPYRRRDPLVFPRARPLPRGDRRSHHPQHSPPHLGEIVDRHLAGTDFNIHVDPAGRAPLPGRGRLSAHLDGCEDGRLGRHSAARAKRSRSTRSGSMRSALLPAGCGRAGEEEAAASLRRPCPARAGFF